LSEPYRLWSAEHSAEQARLDSLYVGQPDIREAKMKEWEDAHPAPKAEIGLIADHIEHIVKVAGYDHVGIGGDFDGITDTVEGLNGVEDYPNLFAELIRRGWSNKDLAKLAGGNVLRVMRQAEAVARAMSNEPPSMASLPEPK
jgi:membrane dipeptidase